MRVPLPLLAALVLAIAACDRKAAPRADVTTSLAGAAAAPPGATADTTRASGDPYPLLDSLPTLTADAVDVATVDSAGLGGVPLCAPLENVNLVFPHAVGLRVYCAEDGCDSPYPARIALTRGGDTLRFESSPISAEIDADGRPLVHYAWTTSRRLASRLGVRPGMSVGQILALGEVVDVPSYEAIVMTMDDGQADTLREGPSVLQLRLRRGGIVAEVQNADTVARYFTRHLLPGRPARDALDTAVRIDAIGVARDSCP